MKTPFFVAALAVTLALLPSATAMHREGHGDGQGCPALTVSSVQYMVGNVTYDTIAELQGVVEAGANVTAIVDLEGCGTEVVTFAAYETNATLNATAPVLGDVHSELVGAGTVLLTITIPSCYVELVLALGPVLAKIDATTVPPTTYEAQMRLLASLDLVVDCSKPEPAPQTEETPTVETPFFTSMAALGLGLFASVGLAFAIMRRQA